LFSFLPGGRHPSIVSEMPHSSTVTSQLKSGSKNQKKIHWSLPFQFHIVFKGYLVEIVEQRSSLRKDLDRRLVVAVGRFSEGPARPRPGRSPGTHRLKSDSSRPFLPLDS
jgi:hypothetical protein